MGIKTVPHPPYSPDLSPCDFWLFPKLRGCRYETVEEMKEAVMKDHWHAHTRGLPWGLPEVVGMVQQVHCSRWRLLRRGLEFHECTINKSAHTKKVWKTYLMIIIYMYMVLYVHIYIYIYIDMYLFINVYIRIHIYVYKYIYVSIYEYVYMCMYIYMFWLIGCLGFYGI